MISKTYNSDEMREFREFSEMYDNIDINREEYNHFYNKRNCVMVLFNKKEYVIGIPKELDLEDLHNKGYKIIICLGTKHIGFGAVNEMYEKISNSEKETIVGKIEGCSRVFISDYFKRRFIGTIRINGKVCNKYRNPDLMKCILKNDSIEHYIGDVDDYSTVVIDDNNDEWRKDAFNNGEWVK